MTVLISMLIGTSLLYLLFIQIRESNELTRTKYRFKYFELRDNLAMLVSKGALAETSWEYRQIIETLNFHISAVERLSLFRIVDVLANYHLSSKEERQVEMFSKRIEDKAVTEIVVGYLETTYELIKRNSRMQLAFVRAIGWLLSCRKSDQHTQAEMLATTPNRALSTIRSHQHAIGASLAIA